MTDQLLVERFSDSLAQSRDATRPSCTTKVFELIAARLGKSVQAVLVFGCGTGGCWCRFLYEKQPEITIQGIDIDT